MLERLWLICCLSLLTAKSVLAEEEISFQSTDGTEVFGYWRSSQHPPSNGNFTAILFHMAGASARGEYQETVDRLNAEGYNTLAVDLRSGGERLGDINKTAAQFEGQDVSYCDAYPDLVAALEWATTQKPGKIFAVGSSFSAALVIKLASEHPDKLMGAVAFSPASGEPMQGCRSEEVLNQLTIPVMVLRPEREMAIPSVQSQQKLFAERSIPYLEIANGRHGSLMLRSSVTGFNMEHAWTPFLSFLINSAK